MFKSEGGGGGEEEELKKRGVSMVFSAREKQRGGIVHQYLLLNHVIKMMECLFEMDQVQYKAKGLNAPFLSQPVHYL